MTRTIKRLALALIIFAVCTPAFGQQLQNFTATPAEATVNSVWNFSVVYVPGEGEDAGILGPMPMDPANPEGENWGGNGIYLTGVAPYPIVMYPAEASRTVENGIVYRVAVSAGLNMSHLLQQPKQQRIDQGIDVTKTPEDADNPCLLRDPRGNPMWYAPGLVSDGLTPNIVNFIKAIGWAPPPEEEEPPPGDEPPPDEEPEPEEPIESEEISVTVHSSSVPKRGDGPNGVEPGTVDYRGAGNLDWLDAYPGDSWPARIPPDPLTPVVPSQIVPRAIRPDDGASSTRFDFRVVYYNDDGLPPSPWMPSWADEAGAGGDDDSLTEFDDVGATGVVLYLDFLNVFDLSKEHQNEGYRPHFMRPEGTPESQLTAADYVNGVVYYYRWQPTDIWGVWPSSDSWYPPTQIIANEYVAMLTGTYHYFFACSDDSLTFISEPEDPALGESDPYLFRYQNRGWADADAGRRNWWDWGNASGGYRTVFRSSTGLDPSNLIYENDDGTFGPAEGYVRYILDENGEPFMAREEGRRYSTYGYDPYYDFQEPKDYDIYVDRENLVPGRFHRYGGWVPPYPWPATEHPEVTVQLSAYGRSDLDGYGRFLGTVEPFYRAVNPGVLTTIDETYGGFGDWGLRMETIGATTSTELKFKIKYFQRDNKAPTSIKVYINNAPYKVINRNQPLTPENGGYVGYTMQPAPVQTSSGQTQKPPYNYALGVDYELKTTLPPGPHTYFFMASDGVATALFPARPENWTFHGVEHTDWWLPGMRSGEVGPGGLDTADFDNNYFPGPFINTPCQLSQPSVTPATGIKGQKFIYRVRYADLDGPTQTMGSATGPLGQRPYEANIYIDTGTNIDRGYGRGIIRATMVKEDPTDEDYTNGVWYVFDSSTLENLTLANGTRRYRFEFVDDWGRATDPNDQIRGEATNLPVTGGWFNGPTIADNVRPTLRNGTFESLDGTSNEATLWQYSVDYKDMNNDPPSHVTVYVGQLAADGETIRWDGGHAMVKADATDNTYNDGCTYVYQTRLGSDFNPVGALAAASQSTDSGSDVLVTAPLKRAPQPVPDVYRADGKLAYAPNRLIIRVAPGTSDAALRSTIQQMGGRLVRPLLQAGSYLIELQPASGATVQSAAAAAGTSPVILDASPDYYYYPVATEPDDIMWSSLWGLRMINAPLVWDTVKGSSDIVVAVLDTGVSPTHPDLAGRLLPGRDTADGDDDPSPSKSDAAAGHGTHVAGTIAAQGDNIDGVVGVCWDGVKILPVKVFPDAGGGAPWSAISDGLDYAKQQGAHVVNMSLGGPYGSSVAHDKIKEIDAAGIILAVAAGNDAGPVSYPALWDECIAVSAVNQAEELTTYSNFGPQVDVAAPGGYDVEDGPGSIWSTYWSAAGGNSYRGWMGTSMAAPHVAGAAALLLSAGVPADEIKDRLFLGARSPRYSAHDRNWYGAGILDVYAALNADLSSKSPVYYYAFEASDGVNRAIWVSADYADENARSESADCMLQEELTTTDNIVYAATKKPLVGTLPTYPLSPGTLVDPIVYKYTGGDLNWPEVQTRAGDYILKGRSYDPRSAVRYDPVDSAYLPSITEVLGVFLTRELTGIDYFHGEDGTAGTYDSDLGLITLMRPLPAGTQYVWVKYRHEGAYTIDRMDGTFTFAAAQSSNDVFKADYYFATRMDGPDGNAQPIAPNVPPTLSTPKLTPVVGLSNSDFIFTVIYKETEGINGQAPAYMRVVIDGIPYDMQPVITGTPSYRAGVVYRYTAKLRSGSHNYYFEASDGADAVTLPVADPNTGVITAYKGPWVNDPPTLRSGMADPNPENDTISTIQAVTYSVEFSDADNDPPVAGAPIVYVDNAKETPLKRSVVALVADSSDPTKYRSLQVRNRSGLSPNYSTDLYAGKSLKFTGGPLAGNAYSIASNSGDVIELMFSTPSGDLFADIRQKLLLPSTVTLTSSVLNGSTFTIQGDDSVVELVADPVETSKYRDIRVLDSEGQPPSFTVDQFAGKLLQFTDTSSPVSGRVYLIASNNSDTLRLLADDIEADGVVPGSTFSIGALRMFKSDPSQMNYVAGVKYEVTAPQLAEGQHKFHFKAASTMKPPWWVPAPYNTTVQSVWVRHPASNEINGPAVAVDEPSTNHPPYLWLQSPYPAVDPQGGLTSTAYDFFISYKDDDGDAPWFHDSVLGFVRVIFNDATYAADMKLASGQSGDPASEDYFKAGKLFTWEAPGLPEGTHRFHFEASDGWVKVRYPSLAQGPDPYANDPMVAVNNKAKLTNISVAPLTGGVSTTFTISLKYSDADTGNFGPSLEGGQEQVWVEIEGVSGKIYLTRSLTDSNFISGVTYTGSKSGIPIGTRDLTCYAKDNAEELTTVVVTDAIRITSNDNTPALSNVKVYKIGDSSNTNGDASGGIADAFRYEVKYSDADGNVPVVSQNGGAIEGLELYIDGKFEVVMTQKVGTDYVSGVTYQYTKQGRTYDAGMHNYQIKAKDGLGASDHSTETAVTPGPDIDAATITLARGVYNSTTGQVEDRDPKILETMRITGQLTATKAIPGSQKLSITVARPDGSGETFTVTGNSENKFSFDRVVTINGTWTITARWTGDGNIYKTVVIKDMLVEAYGPTRVVATLDMSKPEQSAPAVDMICAPLTAPNYDVGAQFGFDRVTSMQIVRWDPEQGAYLRYGQGNFTLIGPGNAVWIKPTTSYPVEDIDSSNMPSPVDPDYPVSATLRYRLLKPFGKLWSQQTECGITLKTGWNQIGSPYLSKTELGSASVIYGGTTMTIAEAASKQLIRNYAWMWDPVSQGYKLVHPTRQAPDVYSRTLDPWRGYWIRSFVDCTLVLAPPSGQSATATSAAEEWSMSTVNALPPLDAPPAAPGADGGNR
ncbi:MAG: S8 family serine peptidase [Armatimonadetes bacterium]|nr:S8 family serine peptidase [Armatimonadota bacterium]